MSDSRLLKRVHSISGGTCAVLSVASFSVRNANLIRALPMTLAIFMAFLLTLVVVCGAALVWRGTYER